jgi:putative hydrolase of the HAD superfamily
MKTIFFDWGGVIADDPGDDFLAKLLREIGATDDQVQEIFQSYMRRFMRGEIPEAEYWDELRSNYGFTIHDSISDEFKKWNGLAANEGVLALVDEAKSRGWQVAILSNVIEPTYNVLKAAGFYDKFDVVIASCKEGFAKPDIEIYRIALEKLNTTASESVFIDDKPSNLTPAKELGFKTILAETPDQTVRDIKDLLMN